MHKTIEWFKKHPLALVLIGGVVILIVVLFSGSSSSAAAAQGDPNAPAEIQAQAQENLATTAANAQIATAQIGANVALAQNQSAEDVNLAGIAAQVQLADISAVTNQLQIKATTDQAALQAQTYEALAADQAATTQKSFQTEEDIAAINANQNIQLGQYQFLGTAIGDISKNKYATLNLTTPQGTSIDIHSGKPASSGGGTDWGSILGGVGALFGL